MSTYANVLIAGREFNVRNDGWDKDTIGDCVREYVAEIKGKVKPEQIKGKQKRKTRHEERRNSRYWSSSSSNLAIRRAEELTANLGPFFLPLN